MVENDLSAKNGRANSVHRCGGGSSRRRRTKDGAGGAAGSSSNGAGGGGGDATATTEGQTADSDGTTAAAGGGGGGPRRWLEALLDWRSLLTRPREFYFSLRSRWERFTREREDYSLWIFKPDDK